MEVSALGEFRQGIHELGPLPFDLVDESEILFYRPVGLSTSGAGRRDCGRRRLDRLCGGCRLDKWTNLEQDKAQEQCRKEDPEHRFAAVH